MHDYIIPINVSTITQSFPSQEYSLHIKESDGSSLLSRMNGCNHLNLLHNFLSVNAHDMRKRILCGD